MSHLNGYHGVQNFVDNRYAKLAAQLIVFLAPFVMTAVGWVFITAFSTYSDSLARNTEAIHSLQITVNAQGVLFAQQAIDREKRLTRIENKLDAVSP